MVEKSTEKVIIHAENVDKWFGNFQALKGVSADIAEGEVVVVLGHTCGLLTVELEILLAVNQLKELPPKTSI